MPFFSLLMPRTFQKKYPLQMRNLRLNSKKLTTPFDIHETLLHFLNFEKSFSNKTNSAKMSRGISLFNYISSNRSCEDAQIEPHWCSCLKWINLKIKKIKSNLDNLPAAENYLINKEYNRLLTENIESDHLKNSNLSNTKNFQEHENFKNVYRKYTKSALILAFKAIEYINNLIDDNLKLFCEKLHLLSIENISRLNLNEKLLLFKESKDIHGREAIFDDLNVNNLSNFTSSDLNEVLSYNNIDDEFLGNSIIEQFNNSYYHELNSFVDTEITFQISLKTWPGDGAFEMSLKYDLKNNKLIFNKNEISRINNYHNTSNCINKIRPDMRQYCYCKFN
jgi:hypothetical protein